MLEKIVSFVNDIVWSPALVVLLVGAGIYFTIRTRFVQLRRIGLMARLLFRKRENGSEIVAMGQLFRETGGLRLHGNYPDRRIRRSECFRVSGGKDIYVSDYKRNNKALAVISHIGKEHKKQTVEIAFDAKKLGLKPFAKATDCMTAPDPDYDWLYAQRKKGRVPPTRAPLKLGDFGSKVESVRDGVLKLTLDYHSFAIVELE